MGGGGGERTERATSKRRRDERRKGNVTVSQEIIILVSLLAVVYTVQALGNWILSALTQGIDRFWSEAAVMTSFASDNLQALFIQCLIMFAVTALPLLLVAMLVAVVGTMVQTRGLFTTKRMEFKMGKLSPLKGLKKMFSLRGIVELLKSILKILILGYVIVNVYTERFQELPRLMEMEFTSAVFYCGEFLMDIITSAAVIFAFIAAADYLYQRWQYEKDIRMTKQEIKEEYKQTEGDPKIKAKIRQKQQSMAMSRMMQSVPEADVVIRNPSHYAVAIRYEAGKNRAPVVTAKGADLLALRIVRVAEENSVLCMENKPLARGLFDTVPLDREIPEEFFQPVAEVLAFVYETSKKHKLPKLKNQAQAAAAPPPEQAPDPGPAPVS